MKNSNELEFLDVINIISFVIGLLNYGENLTQGDKQDLMSALDTKMQALLSEIHTHLDEQDKKIDLILKELNNDNSRYILKIEQSYDKGNDVS